MENQAKCNLQKMLTNHNLLSLLIDDTKGIHQSVVLGRFVEVSQSAFDMQTSHVSASYKLLRNQGQLVWTRNVTVMFIDTGQSVYLQSLCIALTVYQ